MSIEEVLTLIDIDRITRHIDKLATDIGVRESGSAKEEAGADYISESLLEFGYTPQTIPFPMPNGKTSRNVVAELEGVKSEVIIIGAHIDSKPPSPGANDNASGAAVMLELAWIFKKANYRPEYTICFIAFGAEEKIDKAAHNHHYGSKRFAGSPEWRARIKFMTSLDMVGVGDKMFVESLNTSTEWRDLIAKKAGESWKNVATGKGKPYSDHEEFAAYGVPVAYVHWRLDKNYHTANDLPKFIKETPLLVTTKAMVAAIMSFSETKSETVQSTTK